jgi:hypothetical protein
VFLATERLWHSIQWLTHTSTVNEAPRLSSVPLQSRDFAYRKRALAKKEVEKIVLSYFMETSMQSRSLHMKVLITGICGFAGSTIAKALQDLRPAVGWG